MNQVTYDAKIKELITATKNNPSLAKDCENSALGDAFRGAAGALGEMGEEGGQ